MTQLLPPRVLLAIVNARHRADWRGVIRRTWLSQVPKDRADAFFFVGTGEPIPDSDGVVELNCSDAYKDLPSKVQAIVRWARQKDYDYVLKIDDDVVLRSAEFLDSGFDKYEFSGGINRPGNAPVTFGFCYILNKKSMEVISNSPLPRDFDDERWVAHTLYSKGIPLTNADGYSLHQRTTEDHTVKIARCVHLDSTHTQEQKIQEFEKIFNSPVWSGKLETFPLPSGKMTYDRTGLVTDWWSRHER